MSFAFGRRRTAASHPNGDYGPVIKGSQARGVPGYRLEQGIDDTVCRLGRASGNDFFCPSPAEQVPSPAASVENAVAEEHKHIAGLHAELKFIVVSFVKQT